MLVSNRRHSGLARRKRRKVIPWTEIRAAMEIRSATQPPRPPPLMTDPWQLPSSGPVVVAHPSAVFPNLGNRIDAEFDARSDLRCDLQAASLAIQAPHRHRERCPRGVAGFLESIPTSEPIETMPCPIMGKILLTGQQEEIYPLETLCQQGSLAYGDMAKPLQKYSPDQPHRAVQALKENIRALKGEAEISYRGLAKAARVPESVGRTINSLAKGKHGTTITKATAAADGLRVEMWQLFVPGLVKLDNEERKQLRELVEAFIDHGPGTRKALIGVLEQISNFINNTDK